MLLEDVKVARSWSPRVGIFVLYLNLKIFLGLQFSFYLMLARGKQRNYYPDALSTIICVVNSKALYFRSLCPLPGDSSLFTVQVQLVSWSTRSLKCAFRLFGLYSVCTRCSTVQKNKYLRNIGHMDYPISWNTTVSWAKIFCNVS